MFCARAQGRQYKRDSRVPRPRLSQRLTLERLERREMLSASTPIASPSVVIFNPSQIRTAYNFTGLFANYNANAGAGQTIGIVDAYSNPNIFSDLDNFDSAFGLPGPASSFLSVVDQNGGTTLPSYDSGWAVEIALDVEWAHVIAPAAHIVLVEANSPTINDLTAAVDQAVAQGASVVSMSWGASEFPYESTYDSHFNRPGVTFIAAAGDSGAGTEYPAVSPYVVGVGGTSLSTKDSAGDYGSETAWSFSGGGSSLYYSRPTFQANFFSSGGAKTVTSKLFNKGKRLTPDVAYDADPDNGMYVYEQGWWRVGGTSAGAPQWAALIALANQNRAALGTPQLNSAAVLTTLYNKKTYAANFHDIRSGSNGYSDGTGFDLVTGLGSPIASQIVAALTGAAVSSAVASSEAGQGGSGTTSFAATANTWMLWDFTPLLVSATPASVQVVVTIGATNRLPTVIASVPPAARVHAPETSTSHSGSRNLESVDETAQFNPDDWAWQAPPSEQAAIATQATDEEPPSSSVDSEEDGIALDEDA